MYDKLASIYDYFVNWDSRLAYEIPFLEQQLRTLGEDPSQIRVMDSACGTGHHAIALANIGFQVSGSDLYPEMVSLADANARSADAKVIFRTAGFGSINETFKQPGGFDAVLCLGNSLPHVSSEADLEKALLDFKQLLRPGGLLLLQMRNFDKVMQEKNRWMEPQSVKDGSTEWLFLRFYDFEANGMIQFNILSLHRKADAPWHTQFTSTHLLPIYSDKLSKELISLGFRDVRLYGNLAAEPYAASSSGDLVLLANKK
jgi:glycine/sarcosine N-methyltransferase